MRVRWTFVIAVVALALAVVFANAMRSRAQTPPAPATPQSVLEAMFRAPKLDPDAFAASFTSQLPLTTVQGLIDTYRARLGALSSVQPSGNRYLLTFANGSLHATITLDEQSKVVALLFRDEVSAADKAALERVLTADHVSPDWFAPSFLAQIGAGEIDALMTSLRGQAGKFERVDERAAAYYAVFEKGDYPAQIALDGQGRIQAFQLLPPVPKATSLDDALKRLHVGGALLSYLILEGRTEVAALDADRPMAVGSTFKLTVLDALRAQVEGGKHAWSDVVPLAAANKSLPSGVLQTWKDGTPITLEQYATKMISISDNTAADSLIHVVGRAPLEELSPRNTPFLTTRELFVLKSKGSESLRAQYRTASKAQRAEILRDIDAGPGPKFADLDLRPSYLDFEWDFTTRELCTLMAQVEDLDVMTINPGIPQTAWKRIAFKGGSDAGVLNLTNYLTAADGKTYCVSATWNDEAHEIDETAAVGAYTEVLNQLAKRP